MKTTQIKSNKQHNSDEHDSLSYRIALFDPKNATDDEWDQFFYIRERLHYEYTPDEPFHNREVLIKRMRYPNPYNKEWRWFIFLDDDSNAMVGYVSLFMTSESSPEYEENKYHAWAYIIVDRDYRRRGIGTNLIKLLITKLKEENRPIVQVWNEYDSGKQFSKHLGGKLAYRNYENRLKLNDVDWDQIKQWVDEGKKRAPGVKIVTFDKVPEQIIDEFTNVYTETANQAPLEELEGQDNLTPDLRRHQEKLEQQAGTIWITKISIESSGRISGLTEILYNPKEAHVVDQELTGVKKEFRGRGLGKMLKADMVLLIREKFANVDYVRTGNAMINEPMLAINRRMGYKENKQYETYKFYVEDLEKILTLET